MDDKIKVKNKKEKLASVVIAFVVIIIITYGVIYDFINFEIREKKINNVIQENNYYVETSVSDR